jgi:hypothetical protein
VAVSVWIGSERQWCAAERLRALEKVAMSGDLERRIW